MSTYSYSLEMEDSAKGLISNYSSASVRLVRFIPKAELKIYDTARGKVARFRWLGIGEKYYHPVYVFVYYDKEKDTIILVSKPRYPAYLLGLIGAMVMTGLYPAVMINTGKDIRSVLVPDYEKAIRIAEEGLKHGVISGRRFHDFDDISYEGYLYNTPIGYIAFIEEKPPLEPVDFIHEHVEYDEWVHPLEITREVLTRIIARTIRETLEKENKKED